MVEKRQQLKTQESIMLQPSIKRYIKHLCYVPLLHRKKYKQWLSKTATRSLTEQVTAAEKGHRGEICVVIENTLPPSIAYNGGVRARAIDLFARERVWDTEENSGVLVYINLCERSLDIIADRGINSFVSEKKWQELCDIAIAKIKDEQQLQAVEELIKAVGDLLRDYYSHQHYNSQNTDPSGNELADEVRFI